MARKPRNVERLATSVEVVDAYTVRFQLGRNDQSFTEKLYVGIVPEHILAGQDLKTTDFNRIPIGVGPYKMGERRPGERMVLEARRGSGTRSPVDSTTRSVMPTSTPTTRTRVRGAGSTSGTSTENDTCHRPRW